ncbi:oxidoreductase [Staphylococcus sp. ACRSN]|uniref:oxidoreductase n=1 Tax=Staphylococcus sp. ACRSN TaxID=2918214 RepID=UPI001EF20AAA|nr:oxidoreductase [Staphylococcus sp. ACRSN]MCG7339186.1 oxidoreductase [Staphylococcus sp. ACRSN]
MTNIAIVGPGAVGCTIAHDLLPNFPSLALLGRREQKLTYEEDQEPHTITHLNVSSIYQHNSKVDILFIAVKIPQLDEVIKELQHLIHKDTIIILAQNGTGQLSRIPHKHAYQAVVYISGQKQEQIVTHFRDHKILLQDSKHTRALCDLFSNTKLEISLVEDINQAIWYKLLVNLAINTVTALTRQSAKVLKIDGIELLCKRLLTEGIEIAKVEGANFDKNIIDEIMDIYRGYPDHMGTSMYYDIIAGNALEIEGIQGFLYRKAHEHKLFTPTLDTIYPLLLAQQKH